MMDNPLNSPVDTGDAYTHADDRKDHRRNPVDDVRQPKDSVCQPHNDIVVRPELTRHFSITIH